MEQQIQISPIEARILSEITPEYANTIVQFMRKLPPPKRIDDSMSWEDSLYLDTLLDKVRAFLTFRAEKEGGQ